MKTPFTRVGGKTTLRPHIIPKIPEHKTYVEPFLGGGAIYLGKKPSEKEVVNDKDTNLIKAWRELKKKSNVDMKQYDTTDMNKLNSFYTSSATTGIPYLVKEIVKSKNTFSGIGTGKLYRNTSPYTTLRQKKQYEERMKNTTILSMDYEKVIKKYDSPDTFFYLDPPYENSSRHYTHGKFDFEKLASILRKMKGKFLLSLNDSSSIREIFKGFNTHSVTLPTSKFRNRGGSNTRKEVLIQNY